MDMKSAIESPKLGVEQTQPKQAPLKTMPPESEKTKNQEPHEQKATAGDLSDLFAKNIVEENEAGRLAEEMEDVNVDDLLKEGLKLMKKLGKPKH